MTNIYFITEFALDVGYLIATLIFVTGLVKFLGVVSYIISKGKGGQDYDVE